MRTVQFVSGSACINYLNRGRRGEDGEAARDARQPDRPHGSACGRCSQPAGMPILHRRDWGATLVVIDPQGLDQQIHPPQPCGAEHDIRSRRRNSSEAERLVVIVDVVALEQLVNAIVSSLCWFTSFWLVMAHSCVAGLPRIEATP